MTTAARIAAIVDEHARDFHKDNDRYPDRGELIEQLAERWREEEGELAADLAAAIDSLRDEAAPAPIPVRLVDLGYLVSIPEVPEGDVIAARIEIQQILDLAVEALRARGIPANVSRF